MMFETVNGEFYTNALIHAAYRNDIIDVEDYILEGEININDTDDGGSTALHYAVENKNQEMVKLLLENKANVNDRDGTGCRALDYAILNRDQAVIRILLDAGGILTIEHYKDGYTSFRAERLNLAISENVEIANMVNEANENKNLAA